MYKGFLVSIIQILSLTLKYKKSSKDLFSYRIFLILSNGIWYKETF